VVFFSKVLSDFAPVLVQPVSKKLFSVSFLRTVSGTPLVEGVSCLSHVKNSASCAAAKVNKVSSRAV
jgi:hypothetical protein